jgi:hypothetical protein
MEELRSRLSTNSIGKELSHTQWASILAAQIVIEEGVEKALVEDGYAPQAIMSKRHQIRGFLFYPEGTSLSEQTYVNHVRSVEDFGARTSIPYRRVLRAIKSYDLIL